MASFYDGKMLVSLALFALITLSRGKLLGAPEDIGLNDDRVQDAAEFAVDEWNKMSNAMYLSQLVEVLSAKQQVVHGYNYIMTIEIGPTTCRNEPDIDVTQCKLDKTQQHSICEVTVNVLQDKPENEPTMTFAQRKPMCTTVEKLIGD
ncbi:cystatin-like [Saccoglossus kowalevskii]|uniref:Cystatin-like n=1 Tax=Saccoglossus kowalevskii TaxID=10224 RepID=A0ABM0GYT0_SACKO|nr:PREDICTED: cystatin-like [Saccoglossus kowalevskii]